MPLFDVGKVSVGNDTQFAELHQSTKANYMFDYFVSFIGRRNKHEILQQFYNWTFFSFMYIRLISFFRFDLLEVEVRYADDKKRVILVAL